MHIGMYCVCWIQEGAIPPIQINADVERINTGEYLYAPVTKYIIFTASYLSSSVNVYVY